MSNVKLFNSLLVLAVSTTSLELTHISEAAQSAACTLYLQILFEAFKAQRWIGKRVGLLGTILA